MDTIRKLLNTKDYTNSFTLKEKEEGKIYCLIGYLFFFFFIPLLVKNNKYCKFHALQGLNLFLVSIFGGLTITLLNYLFKLLSLNIISVVFKAFFSLVILFFFLFGIINVMTNKARELPLIGGFKIIK